MFILAFFLNYNHCLLLFYFSVLIKMNNILVLSDQSKSFWSFLNFLFRKIKIFKAEIPFVIIIWFGLAAFASVAQVLRHGYNDYLIYTGVFWHTMHQTNLYNLYPHEYTDSNHYGPVFSLIIAPFALLPVGVGAILWGILNAAVLLYAIRKLSLNDKQQLIIVAVAAIDMMTSTHYLQFNPALTACILFSFILVEKENDFWATLFIAIGFFVKLYGIGAILFFVFSKHKVRFILYFLFWCVVLFSLPMLLSSPKFIVQCYVDWYHSLAVKNVRNADVMASGGWQDLSVMGMIRRIFSYPQLNNLMVIAPAFVLIALPLLRFKQYAAKTFRMSYLAIVLMAIVIFSTGAESPTFVIAMTGVGIWFALHEQPDGWVIFVLILALLLTSLSSSDIFPKWVKAHVIRAYALKALAPFVVWVWLIASVSFKNCTALQKRRTA